MNTKTLKLTLITSILAYSTPVLSKTLTAEEISTQIIGVQLNWKNRRGRIGKVIYNADGTFKWRAGVNRNGTGEWRVENNKLCNTFHKTATWEGRPWRCHIVKTRKDQFRIGQTSVWK